MKKICVVHRSYRSKVFLIIMNLCGIFSSYADEISKDPIVEFCSQSLFPSISSQDILLTEKVEVKNAEAALDRGNFIKAIENYNTAIALYPNSPFLHYRRGFCYTVLNNISKALKDYRLVIEIDPNFTLAYSDRAYIYLDMGDYQKAINDFNHLIEKGICDSYSLKSRGIAYYHINELDKAQSDLEAALVLLTHEQQPMINLLPSDSYNPEELEIKELLLEISRLKLGSQRSPDEME